MMRRFVTRNLALATTGLCALGALAGPAAAEVVTVITIDPGQQLGGTVAANPSGDSLNSIANLLNAFSSATLVQESDNTLNLDLAVGANLLFTATLEGSQLYATARANNRTSLLGLLPGVPADPPDSAVAGAAILTGEVSLDTTLLARAADNSGGLSLLVGAAATVNADFDSALVLADGTFNSNLSSIELLPSTALRPPAGPASYDDFGTVLVELQATLSVAGSQINSAYGTDPDVVQDPGLPSANALSSGNSIQLTLQGQDDGFFAGQASLGGNQLLARAGGNANDGSILLRNEITTDEGTQVGPGLYSGTALILNQQNSDDISDGDADFRGEGITALALDDSIIGSVVAGTVGQDTASLDSFALEVTDNLLSAQAMINVARGEIAFVPALTLQGSDTPLDQGSGDSSVLLQERLGLRSALADYLIISRQSVNRREAVDPVANGLLLDSAVTGELTTPATFARLALDGNTLQANADGNRNDAILQNRLDAADGETAVSIDATLALLNWQWVSAPDFAARIAGTGDGIAAELTLLAPAGDQAASLALSDNSVSARANGNVGTAQVDLAALDLSLDLATLGPAGAVANAGAVLFSFHGATNAGDTFGATAGGVTASYQILDSANASHSEQDFLAPAVLAEVVDSALAALLTVSGPRAPDSSLTLSLEASGNLLEARAAGSRYQAAATLATTGLFTGSFGQLAAQFDNDQSVSASLSASGLALTLDASAIDAGDFAATVTVSDNTLLAVAGINSSNLATTLQAGVVTAGGWSSLYDAGDPRLSLGGLIQGYQFNSFRATRHNLYANAAIALLNDQTVDEGDAEASLTESGITVELLGDPATLLGNVALQVDGNRVVAQSRLNDASNTILFDSATLLQIDPAASGGALAGIVSAQGSGQGFVAAQDQPDLPERASHATASSTDSGIAVLLPGMTGTSLEISGNLLGATAAANVAANSVTLSATSLRAGLGEPASVAILHNGNDTDFDLAVLGSVFIANSQRNEWQLFGGGPGPAVVAFVGGEAGIRVVSSGELQDSLVTISDNALVGEARANVAQNVITLSAVTLEASGQIVSRQGNSGDVSATLEGATISLELNAGPGLGASEGTTIVIERNSISGMALGNAVLNVIDATASGAFLGFDGSPAQVVEELPATSGATTVTGDYTILNRQVNQGTAEQPLQITSTVVGAQFAVNLDGNHDATSVTLRDNNVTSLAYGNVATNSVTLRAAGGSLPSSAIVNQQNNAYANITATASGSGVNVNLSGNGAGVGVFSGSNGVAASAIGNSATNTMSARSGGPLGSN